jgi:hypothetical protein
MSRKKKKSRKQARKPRASEVRVDFGREQIVSGMKVADDGTLIFFGEHGEVVTPVRIETGSAYVRPTKAHKVLTRQVSEPAIIQLNPNRGLSRFAFVFAVDTNTIEITGKRVSMSVPVLVRDIEIDEQRWNAKLVPQDPFEFHEATISPERIGWWETIRRFTIHPDVRGPVGLVVDSDLGNISAINARQQPILDEFYLPEGVELLYGCGDRGTQEFIANAAIADCDRIASQLLDRLRKEGCSGNYSSMEGAPYARYRYWTAPSAKG